MITSAKKKTDLYLQELNVESSEISKIERKFVYSTLRPVYKGAMCCGLKFNLITMNSVVAK